MAPENALDSFRTRDRLSVDDTTSHIHRLDRVDGSARLPYSPVGDGSASCEDVIINE